MGKKKSKAKQKSIAFQDYPLIGYEYDYLGQPVKVIRSCPSGMGPQFGHVEFETRFGERSSCDSGELGYWQDVDGPLTKSQATLVMLCVKDAIEDASSDSELRLAKWQYRRIAKLAKSIS